MRISRHGSWMLVVCVAAALAARPDEGRGQEFAWSGTVQYSQGKYIFTETTRSWSLYSGLSWQGSRLRFSAGIPVVVQDSRAITYVGDLPIPTGGPDSEAVGKKSQGEPVPMGGHRAGTGPGTGGSLVVPLGLQTTGTPVDSVQAPGSMQVELADPMLSAGLQLVAPSGSFLGLDLTGSVKVPVRSLDSGVGTGEWDFGLGLSGAVGRSPLMLYGDVGWWRYGDLPGLELKDAVSWGAGLGILLGSRLSGLVGVSGSTGVMDAVDPPAEVSALLSFVVGEGKSVMVGGGIGLSEASPDVSFSVGSRITLVNR